MAKVTIVISDENDTDINVAANFDPPIRKGEVGTTAQGAAVAMLEYFSGLVATEAAKVIKDEITT